MSIESPARPSAYQERLLIPEARGHQRRRHRRATMVIVAALGVGTIVTIWLVAFGGSTHLTDSGPATPAQLKVDAAACQAYWKSTSGVRSKFPGGEPATLPTVTVSDVRGSEAALLYMAPHGSWTCFMSSSSVVGIEGSPDGSFWRTPSAADPVTLSSAALFSNVNDKFQVIEGRTERTVSSVTLTLSDGTVVRPTLRGGYLLAFWPGTASVVSSTYRVGHASYQSGSAPPSPSQEFGDHSPKG